ncbi:hypothetical protein [Klebsiella quasipneumoniae]|uniref:hypothetical protein n=1 Tax=Klebsiella quasipneumoniae TaxID=1463165 RepID=UPI003F66DE42
MNNDGLTLNQLAERNAVLVTEVEKLRAERDQLAAENVALKESRNNLAEFIHEELDADYPLNMNLETHATDRIIAGIKADGVEEFVSNTVHKIFDESGAVSALAYLSLANSHVKQLREGADK